MMRVGNESYAMMSLKASLSRISKRQDNCSSRKVSWKKENLCRVFTGRTGDPPVKKGEGEGSNQSKRNERGNSCSVNLKQSTFAGEWVRMRQRRNRSHEWHSKKFELYFENNEEILKYVNK